MLHVFQIQAEKYTSRVYGDLHTLKPHMYAHEYYIHTDLFLYDNVYLQYDYVQEKDSGGWREYT